MTDSATEADAIGRSAMRKATLRIVPFLIICYFFAYLDRVNVGLAALSMNKELGLSSSIFGLGSGIFFFSYFLFEVPSNLMLEKVGASRWIARIMLTWGVISASMIFISGPKSFILVRFLLGAAEAGFYPGAILYITYFFPRKYRSRVVAAFTLGVPLSLFLGSPISAGLLSLHGFLNMSGWRWLFLLEGIPPIALGVISLFLLTDHPSKARWLTADEKAWISRELSAESNEPNSHRHPIFKTLFRPTVIGAALIYFGIAAVGVTLAVWQPQMIKSFGLSNTAAGLLNAIPWGVTAVGMIAWGRLADGAKSRMIFVVVPLLVLAATLLSIGIATALWGMILMLSLAMITTYSVKGPFWALISEILPKNSSAVAFAQINAIGGLGSFFGIWVFGVIKDATGSFTMGLLPEVALTVASAIVAVVIVRSAKPGTP